MQVHIFPLRPSNPKGQPVCKIPGVTQLKHRTSCILYLTIASALIYIYTLVSHIQVCHVVVLLADTVARTVALTVPSTSTSSSSPQSPTISAALARSVFLLIFCFCCCCCDSRCRIRVPGLPALLLPRLVARTSKRYLCIPAHWLFSLTASSSRSHSRSTTTTTTTNSACRVFDAATRPALFASSCSFLSP